jgi:hypothetical protein
MRARAAFWFGSTVGILETIGSTGLHQDWLGKEKFLLFARDHWQSARISVPIEIAMLVAALAITAIVSWRTRVRAHHTSMFAIDGDVHRNESGLTLYRVQEGSWSYGCEGHKFEDRFWNGSKVQANVELKFVADSTKKTGIVLVMAPSFARDLAREMNKEADFAEAPEGEERRKTSWAKLDDEL